MVHVDSFNGNIWIADSGASCHHNNANMYDLRTSLPGHEKRILRVEYMGNIDEIFQGYMDEPLTSVFLDQVSTYNHCVRSRGPT